jgi:putative hydrolase of the HAD superfamily
MESSCFKRLAHTSGSAVIVAGVGVILDSGGVLIRPTNGRWFPPPAFHDVLTQRGLTWDDGSLSEALLLGEEYLDAVHATPLADEVAEHPLWVGYYEIVLEALGIGADRSELSEAITVAWERSLPVEVYPWTRPVLQELRRRGIAVVVLSDAWPSLRRFFRQLGLEPYVQAMVISAEEGVTKPDPRVYDKAGALLGEGASTVYFVDDWPPNVRAAVDLGMRGLCLCRRDAEPDDGIPRISDLRELLDHL